MKKASMLVGLAVALFSFSSMAASNAGGAVRGKDRAVQSRQTNIDRLTAKKGADSKVVQKQTANLEKFKTKQGLNTPAPAPAPAL